MYYKIFIRKHKKKASCRNFIAFITKIYSISNKRHLEQNNNVPTGFKIIQVFTSECDLLQVGHRDLSSQVFNTGKVYPISGVFIVWSRDQLKNIHGQRFSS